MGPLQFTLNNIYKHIIFNQSFCQLYLQFTFLYKLFFKDQHHKLKYFNINNITYKTTIKDNTFILV